MNSHLTTLQNNSGISKVARPTPGGQRAPALLRRWLWAAVLALPALGAHAAVIFTNLYSFTSGNDGESPYAGLAQGSNGNFYGTTTFGGTNGAGTVFLITTNGALTSLYSFTNGTDGSGPYAGLAQGRDGNFYGTTEVGGPEGDGTMFRITTNGALTHLYSFTGTNDGVGPQATLVQGSDGFLYGTTAGFSGRLVGAETNGTVFRISTNGVATNLYTFTGGDDGAHPVAGLAQGSPGVYYGTTEDGGTNGAGTVFKINTNGALTNLYSFTGGNDGANPTGGLALGSDGLFYGTTQKGGKYTNGSVFQISANGTLTNLYSFTGGNDGANPVAGLIQASDGYLYGTTEFAGAFTNGTVFKISTNGALTTLHSFNGTNDGANPTAGLVQAADGRLYGTTAGGGLSGAGTVFRLTVVPVPAFTEETLAHGALTLTWTTAPGAEYQLIYSSALNSTNWTNLGGALSANGATLSETDYTTNGPHRFYQVALLP